MSFPLRNLLLGATGATTIALLFIVPTLGGVSTWKYVLAVLGAALFIVSGLSKTR